MNINAEELYRHANTVLTACTYIKEGGLLSRGEVERRNLQQTPQKSDEKDKEENVWNDIFLDRWDLHGYFPRGNEYGPVCFVLKIELLLDEDFSNIAITRNNPIYWTSLTMKKYHSSVHEYQIELEKVEKSKKVQHMFTIKSVKKELFFRKYLTEIILDDPGVGDVFIDAKIKLLEAMRNSRLDETILRVRKCTGRCYCSQNYGKLNKEELMNKF